MSDSRELLRQAFQAILAGDDAERDRLCKLAEEAVKREELCERKLREIRASDSLRKH